MTRERTAAITPTGTLAEPGAEDRYQKPTYEVICLACEISAYAPDGDTPLF